SASSAHDSESSPQPKGALMDTGLRSRSKTITIGHDQPFCVIGERINPTGRKVFVAPALAARNTVVSTPASTTAVCSGLLADCVAEAALPEGVFNFVLGT